MKKVLFVANVHKHFIAFHIPYIKWLKDNGCIVHCAANGSDIEVPFVDRQINLCIQRSPWSIKNIVAYIHLKKLIKKEQYDIIHCHTPIASVVARLSARSFRENIGLKLFYTAHGFYFYKRSPFIYWIIYYPLEKYLSRYTDVLLTINKEDYELVKNRGFKNVSTYLIPGVGVDTNRLYVTDDSLRLKLRKQYGYDHNLVIIIYIAEFIKRKNHQFVLDCVPDLVKECPNCKIIFAGDGPLLQKMKKYASDQDLSSYVDFLGYCKNIGDLIALSDIGISSSLSEGLGLNVAEELYSGLPVVVSEDRGHRELVEVGINGFIYPQGDSLTFVKDLLLLVNDKNLRLKMSSMAALSIKRFILEEAQNSLINIYKLYL
ncbi:glycosyltransferase family 4 protein [Parabacteroides faecis]|uniref:glycosyltransferase family 4 protein n=1 Tax=Parabacteroides TaxID=375288 RepID=UPI0011C4591C|nr:MULTISPECIES: glycosyltransferase family 4 protein [Parabacteroides]MBC8617562.1 glycosyltransferase family 4 protein [Parabacteroides faecis]